VKFIKFLFAFVLFLGSVSVLYAKDFVADYIAGEGASRLVSKLYFSDGNIRLESPQSISIIRKNSKIVWILIPEQKSYMEIPFSKEMARDFSSKVEGEVKREKIGTENVNGMKADKYKVVYLSKGKDYTFYQWISTDSGFPVKSASLNGKVFFELKNLKFVSSPKNLFVLPPGYKKISYNIPKF